MSNLTANEIIQQLLEMESRSRQFAKGLPQQVEIRQLWEGILFSVAGMQAIAPMDEVKEILNFPPAVTKVPGTKPWILGIANVRGTLLPVVDLQAFLGGSAIAIGRRSRLLVINHEGLYTGLLINDVRGMRHFGEEQRRGAPSLFGKIREFVGESYEMEGHRWPVLSMNRLAADGEFRAAALH